LAYVQRFAVGASPNLLLGLADKAYGAVAGLVIVSAWGCSGI
jgi:hypothetical protein